MKAHENCRCKELTHQCKLVVVTGGPGAGKTAILEIAKKSFCEHIVVIPEAASIVFGGGFWRRDTLAARKGAQRAIFHIQRELERVVIEEGTAAIALCDRGTLDGLAYWPDSEEAFFREVGVERKSELDRYAAVIHVRSPARNEGYNLSNPIRIESAEEATNLDLRIEEAWKGHPDREFIKSQPDFLQKAQQAMRVIRRNLPPCCREHRIEEFGEQ